MEDGTLWITNPPATSWKEPVPAGTLNAAAELHPPPDRVEPRHLTQEAVPAAWSDRRTNGLALTQALCQKRSSSVPWGMVREGIGDAVQARWLELARDSGPVECTYDQAGKVVLEKPRVEPKPADPPKHILAELDAGQLQDLADRVPDLLVAVGAAELRFGVSVRATRELADEAREKVNEILAEVSKEHKRGG